MIYEGNNPVQQELLHYTQNEQLESVKDCEIQDVNIYMYIVQYITCKDFLNGLGTPGKYLICNF